MNGANERTGRDGRLLALVIVVSLAVLFVLARFRFVPSDGAPALPTAGPLEQLAARSTYEDLAATVASLVQRLSTSVVVVQLAPAPPEEKEKPGAGRKGTAEPVAPAPPRLAAAIRVGQDLAVTHLPAGFQVIGGQGLAAPIQLVATDLVRGIAVVQASSVLDISNGTANALTEFTGFSYVAAVEAAPGGLTAAPVFVGRADIANDPRWPSPIRVLGGTPTLPVGALIFALDTRFIGLVMTTPDGSRALVPASAIDAAVLTLTSPAKGGGRP
jgi:hypothetical protein